MVEFEIWRRVVLCRGKALAAIIAVGLGGCVTTGMLDEKLKSKYLGQTIDDVVKVLGYPLWERTVGGRQTYVWEKHENRETVRTSPYINPPPYIGTQPLIQYHDYVASEVVACNLTVEVNEFRLVVNVENRGNSAFCQKNFLR